MYKCEGCGSGLKFDIATQKLKCEACGSLYNPYSVGESVSATEKEMLDVTVFACPQCGGEMYSTDETAVGFCSYCGEQAELSGRMYKAKRPRYIIPFAKTKEDCKTAYLNLLKKHPFVPDELKKPECVD